MHGSQDPHPSLDKSHNFSRNRAIASVRNVRTIHKDKCLVKHTATGCRVKARHGCVFRLGQDAGASVPSSRPVPSHTILTVSQNTHRNASIACMSTASSSMNTNTPHTAKNKLRAAGKQASAVNKRMFWHSQLSPVRTALAHAAHHARRMPLLDGCKTRSGAHEPSNLSGVRSKVDGSACQAHPGAVLSLAINVRFPSSQANCLQVCQSCTIVRYQAGSSIPKWPARQAWPYRMSVQDSYIQDTTPAP